MGFDFSTFTTPVTTATILASGATRRQLDDAVRNREVRRLLRGVFVHASVEDGVGLRVQAVGQVVAPRAVVCDRTAAWIHGCEVFDYRELDVPPPVESYVLRGRDPTDRPECAGGTRDLVPADWCEIAGLRVTTPLRTAMDLGCKLPPRTALAAMDALMREHGVTLAKMVRLLPRYRRRRGVVQLRRLVPLTDPSAESQPESWMRLEIVRAGLPDPTPQYWVLVGGVPTYRLDLAWPHARVAVEYDGEEWHTGPEARERDRVRRQWLRDHGWTVIVLTKESFRPGAVDAWIHEVRQALRLV
ncbi:hypothetical protein [Nocardioides dongkuii]|uniref:hypothetical protein n=1 Tax=Nocardioides dongkuii TaxID=2760089 RepID=UPI0015F98488|nr:hypothetical protein [Nocardioides dongkuii]